jgi:hypothetical protein
MLPRRFTDLSAFGRSIIATVAVLTVAITAVAFVASYNALYRLFSDLGLYGEWVTRAIPLLLDAAFIGGELAAILAGMLRAITGDRAIHRGWPAAVVLVCGALTIALNVVHAYLLDPHAGPLTFWRCLAAALPPGLMILAFQIDIAIVRWVMIALGRPLIGVDTPGHPLGVPQVPAGGAFGGYGAGTFPQQGAYGEMPSQSAQRAGQNGHDRGWKGEQTREYLGTLDAGELAGMTRAQLTADMHTLGVPIDETYAGAILGKHRANGAIKERRR